MGKCQHNLDKIVKLRDPNIALKVVAVEQLLGIDCDEAAEEHRLAQIRARERLDRGSSPTNGGNDIPAYYEQLEATVKHI